MKIKTHKVTNMISEPKISRRSSREFSDLIKVIQDECQGKNVYFFANPGNLGDALIRHGAISILSEAGIKYKELYRKPVSWIIPFLRGGVFIYGGGGAWCEFWNTGEKYCRLFSKRFRTIVFPSTYDREFKIKNVLFFRRDQFESKKFMPKALFCHDLAFYLQPKNIKATAGAGYFFRRDAEAKSGHVPPSENLDISARGTQLSPPHEFFQEVGKHETIFTDRLHVAIAGCLLGRKVHLYANGYFKNKAIFRTSISPFYKGCHFHDEPFSGITALRE